MIATRISLHQGLGASKLNLWMARLSIGVIWVAHHQLYVIRVCNTTILMGFIEKGEQPRNQLSSDTQLEDKACSLKEV